MMIGSVSANAFNKDQELDYQQWFSNIFGTFTPLEGIETLEEAQLYRSGNETGFGISGDDVNQNDSTGNCWVLAGLATVADTNPETIYKAIHFNKTTGKYEVTLRDLNGRTHVIEVDPNDIANSSQYGKLWNPNQPEDNWVRVMAVAVEKLMNLGSTGFHGLDNTSANGGFTGLLFYMLGVFQEGDEQDWGPSQLTSVDDTNFLDVQLRRANDALNGGAGATISFVFISPSHKPIQIWDSRSGLISSHAYQVIRIEKDPVTGEDVYVLRNPWGVNSPGMEPGGDGVIRVTRTELLAFIKMAKNRGATQMLTSVDVAVDSTPGEDLTYREYNPTLRRVVKRPPELPASFMSLRT